MSVTVVVPWRPDGEEREAARRYVMDRLHDDGFDVILGEHRNGPWSKSVAVEDGLTRTSADVIVIHDADVRCDGVATAVEHVVNGVSRWAVPHTTVRRLTRDATVKVLADGPLRGTTERAYVGVVGGGITVIRRDLYEEAPFDRRFLGWGQEDLAAGLTWRALGGAPWRGRGDLWHLWHPPQPRLTAAVGSRDSQLLLRRYRAAANDPLELRALVAEGRSYDTVDSNFLGGQHGHQ